MFNFLVNGIVDVVAQFLTDRCTILDQEQGTDEIGAPTQAQRTLSSDVPCRLIRGDKPSLKDFAFQEKSRETYRLILGPSTQIATGQRVQVGTVVYEVLGLRQALTDEAFHEALIGVLQ